MRIICVITLLVIFSCNPQSKEAIEYKSQDLKEVSNVNSTNLPVKKFQFDQQYKIAELELRKAELKQRQSQQSNSYVMPIMLSILGGLITIVTGLFLRSRDNRYALRLEDSKTQSSIIIKAAESNSYEDFVNILDTLKDTDLIKISADAIEKFKDKKHEIELEKSRKTLYAETISTIGFIISSEDFKSDEFKRNLQRFWQLYWVELPGVESNTVATAMINLGKTIENLEKGEYSNFEQLQKKLKVGGFKVREAMEPSKKEKQKIEDSSKSKTQTKPS